MDKVYDESKNELYIRDVDNIIIISTIRANSIVELIDGGTFTDTIVSEYDGGAF